ncbi:MAG: hypothetical protein JSW50_00960 [Candidatus Latescibacterota bacterium]|nr:MAG: hypothetical protein JSW50_00960 [Candidatus Latescibacterota bacterium]
MSRQLLPILSVLLFLFLLAPTISFADASVVQDSCVAVIEGPPPWPVWTYFTIVNFSLPAPVCDLHFIPEPQPPDPGCVMIGTINAAGWSSFLNPLDGADFFANTLGDCVPVGGSKGGFAFLLDPDYCCYIVQFTDPTGAVMLEQEECFTCQKVPVETRTWGHIKGLYE